MYKNRWQQEIEYFRAKGCCVCGTHNDLTAHHIYPPDKKFPIGGPDKYSYTFSEFLQELQKCVCICRSCHDKVHGFVPCGLTPTQKRRAQRKRAAARRANDNL